MRYGHIDRDDGPGWVFGVLLLAAAVIRVGQLLAAGDYATLVGDAVLIAVVFVLIMIASVHMRGVRT